MLSKTHLRTGIILGALTWSGLANPSITQAQNNSQGNTVVINGNQVSIPWRRQGNRLEMSDTGLMYQMGLELFDTNDHRQQVVDAYANTRSLGMSLETSLDRQYRYLDISKIALANRWSWQTVGQQLQISTGPSLVTNVQASQLGSDQGKITVQLNNTVPWRLSQDATEGFLTVYTAAKPQLIQPNTTQPAPSGQPGNPDEPGDDQRITNTQFKVTSSGQKTVIQFPIKLGSRALAKNTSGRRILIEINPLAMTERSISWAPGLVWRQKWQALGRDRFPVSILELDPRLVKLKPILGQDNTVIGSQPIGLIANRNRSAAAINGGFFNRNNRYPLGALKIDGKWLSSPILSRGALGWTPGGGWQIARLTYSEAIANSQGQRVTNTYLNSGLAQNGVARYTPDWGATYQPITSNETIFSIQNDRISQITPAGVAGSLSIPIPSNGYLLVGRGAGILQGWQIGSKLSITSASNPAAFDRYTHILGAGPWLMQNRQIVLDARAENFGAAFTTQSAARSAIFANTQGKLSIVAVQERAGGKGPTLDELARLLKQMGAVDALNLDGGSSTSMVLGGQLVNRSPATAARVHNGLGIFLEN